MTLSNNQVVYCLSTVCHTPYGALVRDFIDGIKEQKNVLKHIEDLSYLEDSLGGETSKKIFQKYLKQRKAAKLFTPAAKLALGTVGTALEELQKEYPFLRDSEAHRDTGIFFAVGREPPDDGDAEEMLLLSEHKGSFDEEKMSHEGKLVYPPLLPLKTLPNMVLAHTSIHLGIQGENGCWAGEDEAGWTAIWSAFWSVVEGRTDLAILCGSESYISLGLARDRLRSEKKSHPSESSVTFVLASQRWMEQNSFTQSTCKITASQLQSIEDSYHHENLHHLIFEYMGDCGAVNPLLYVLWKLSI